MARWFFGKVVGDLGKVVSEILPTILQYTVGLRATVGLRRYGTRQYGAGDPT